MVTYYDKQVCLQTGLFTPNKLSNTLWLTLPKTKNLMDSFFVATGVQDKPKS